MVSKFISLKKSGQFQSVYRQGISKGNRYFVMLVKENDLPHNRIGISVSKKVGNSIVRHRVTRVIREVFRLRWDEIGQGYDIVVVARAFARQSEYQKFENAIIHLLELHHLWEVD